MFQNLNQQDQKVSLKIVIGGDCFRLNKLPQSYSELDEIVRKKFENKIPDNFCFKYEDSDNDSINVESNSDYEAFLEYCIQEKLRSIKLRIDSKTFKQYFSCYDQQQIGGIQQGNSNSSNMQNQQNIQNLSQIQQCNAAMGMLVNPYMTLNQNIQRGIKTSSNFQSQNNDYQQSQINMNQGMDQGMNQILMQMILTQQGIYNNLSVANMRNGSVQGNNNANNNNNNNNNNQNMNTININNSNLNNNTNAVNNSVSSQQPLLSKGTSEVQNASEQVNSTNLKRYSVNQSQSGMITDMSFALTYQEKKNINSIPNSNNNQINRSGGGPNMKQSGKNELQAIQLMHFSSQYNDVLNQTSRFSHQDSIHPSFHQMLSEKQENQSIYNIPNLSNTMDLESVQNPMDGDDKLTSGKDIKSSSKFPTQPQIKRINSMSGEIKEQPTLSSHQQMSFMPKIQSYTSELQNNLSISKGQLQNITNNTNSYNNNINNNNIIFSNNNQNTLTNSQTFSNVKSLTNLKQNEIQANSNDINVKNQTTGVSNYFSNNLQGQQINMNQQIEGIENDISIKRESHSPSVLQQLTNSTNIVNIMNQTKIQNRPSNISTNRSGQNTQIPCEKCIIQDEEQKYTPLNQQQEKTPTNNTSKDLLQFIPNPNCSYCDGTGFLKIEDQNQFNVIQTIMRHKLKEAELILKSLSVRQQKVEKIIPKDSMDLIQNILNAYDNNQIVKQSDQNDLTQFTPDVNKIDQSLNELSQNKTDKSKAQNIFKINCFECKNEISHQSYFYLCINCKQKNTNTDDNNSAKKSTNSQSKKQFDDLDLDHILCESCEGQHESSHLVVQISKEDILTMHSTTTQQNQVPLIIPQQKIVNFDKYSRQSEPRKSYFTQSMGIFLPQNTMTAPKTTNQTFFNNLDKVSKLEQSYQVSNMPPQLQQQQSIIQQMERTSIADHEGLPAQLLTKMRSKTDSKSQTTIVRNSVQQDGFDIDFEHAKDDSQIPLQQIGGQGRFSTNQNIFKPQNQSPVLITQKTQSITTKHKNSDEEEPPTFNDTTKYLNNTSTQDQTMIQAIIENVQLDGNYENSPIVSVVSQNPLILGETLNEIETPLMSQKDDLLKIIKKQKADANQEQKPENEKQAVKITPSEYQENQDGQVNQKISFSKDVHQEPQRISLYGSNDLINGSMCVKSSYNNNTSKLTQSSYLAPSKTSLTSSMVNKPDDSRMQSQYRAKLVNSFCSSDILSDDSVIVFQEILNNGIENWPENVYLKCISGITDNCQYPVIQVNKGETMSIAFPIKIDKQKANEGEQIKTAWRLYYQQQNEERKFFGPKITIDFIYKKSKKAETEQTLDYVLQQSANTLKNIFNKEDIYGIEQFVKQYQFIAEEYLADKNDDVTISKLIVRYIQYYVTSRSKKSIDD